MPNYGFLTSEEPTDQITLDDGTTYWTNKSENIF